MHAFVNTHIEIDVIYYHDTTTKRWPRKNVAHRKLYKNREENGQWGTLFPAIQWKTL